MRIVLRVWGLLVCLVVSLAFAQQGAPTDRVITLNLAVTDKAGKAVTGLQQSDFALLDNKQPRNLLSFHEVAGGTAAADSPVQVILLIDEINTPFVGVAMEREAVEKFLGLDGGKLAFPVSVVLLADSGTALRTQPSRDGTALMAELNKAEFGLRTIRKSLQGIYGADDQRRLSIDALDQLAKHEAATPGRKLVVWISPGWPLFPVLGGELSAKDQQATFTDIVAFSNMLPQARITLYNIDPWGPMQDQLQRNAYEQFLKGARNPGQAQLGSLGLQVLAYRSGGRVLDASNDVAGEIATCVADAKTYYVIAFDGLPGDGPNEYHDLEIKIDKPKLTVRAPSGYYAQPLRAPGR